MNLEQHTMIMGIINLTPDSFSGDGLLKSMDPESAAVAQAKIFIAAGAEILDVGGESTRPGAMQVDQEEELRRVVPAIKAMREAGIGAIISVDTYKSRVAQAALEAGANWINDVWGLRADPELAKVAANWNVPIILMHNRSNPANSEIREHLGGRYKEMVYQDLIEDIKNDLLESISMAKAGGVKDENIILDPGLGFGKTVEQNLILLNRLNEICDLGYPVLLGPSRKSFIGYTLNLPPDDRLAGTAAAVILGVVRGAKIIRVHDVPFMVRVARMTDAIINSCAH
ncbi:MAG TPA: dihydropteroate synthase [Anaerolineaceae bacterium]|nr:dihydropteroate synthase [Anaerolineaceae bacterium]HPN52427.1 dihydropteroate synthase [Anaerolineaceae bacterium]